MEHEQTDTNKKQYAFIGDILESRMFRSKSKVEDLNARDMADCNDEHVGFIHFKQRI